jgi:hypothetical protein
MLLARDRHAEFTDLRAPTRAVDEAVSHSESASARAPNIRPPDRKDEPSSVLAAQ